MLVSGSKCSLEVLEHTPHIHFDTLSPQVFDTKTILISSGSINKQIRDFGVCYVTLHHENVLRQGYLVAYGDENINVLLESESGPTEMLERSPIETTADPLSWEMPKNVDFSEPKAISPEFRGFMRPPAIEKRTKITQQSPINEKSPQEFLRARYYNILYQIKMPLSYFAKTTLPRLRNMCENSQIRAQVLMSLYLTVDEFSRTQERFRTMMKGPGTPSETYIPEQEIEHQQNFISLNFEGSSDENKENMVLGLKIREAQLQILLVLELILAGNLDERTFVVSQPPPPEKRRSLVRKKGKKIMPTLSGLAVSAPLDPDSGKTEDPTSEDHKVMDLNLEQMQEKIVLDQESLRKSLFSLIDQIGLWDSLLGRKNGSDENTHGFLAYVVVPYFNKSLPALVPTIIKAFKSLRPRLKAVKKRVPSTPTEETGPSLVSIPKKPKFSKQLLSADQVSLLHRASSSDLQDLKPAFSLKRSKSNLGGSKDLKRRQVDMSVSKNEVEDVKTQSFIFADARKIKSATEIPSMEPNIARKEVTMQVGATPAKPSKKAPERVRPQTTQVMATPLNNRTVDLGYVKETPVMSIHEKLNKARDGDYDTHNMQEHGEFGNFQEFQNNLKIPNLQAIESSPVRPESPVSALRIKPGSKYSLQDSRYKYKEASPFSVPSSSSGPSKPKKAPQAKRGPKLVRKVAKKEEFGEELQVKEVQNVQKIQKEVQKEQVEIIDEGSSGANGFESSSGLEISGVVPLTRQDTFKINQSLDLDSNSVELEKPGKSLDSFNGSGDSDSDSDYERLLAASKPIVRKYSKRR